VAKTGLPNFALKFCGPWRGIVHTWSITSSHSGSAITTEAQVLTFLNAVQAVFAAFMAPSYGEGSDPPVYVTGWAYYNGTSSAALWEKEYTTSAEATADGFTLTYGVGLGGGTTPCSAEVCVMLMAPVGESSTGKPVALRHYIHYTGGSGESFTPATGAAAIAASLGNGDLPFSRVLTGPTGKQGDWVIYPFYSNHQMQRKRRKSSSSSSSSSLLSQLEKAFAAKGAVNTLEEILAGL
jgi:hypothetical protein